MRATVYILIAYFLVGSILPGMDFSQLTKLPNLIEHYRHHHSTDDKTTALAFFLQHFINPNLHHHKDAGDCHKKLPLKSFEHSVNYFISEETAPAVSRSFFYKIPPLSSQEFLSILSTTAVFRPPISVL
ncbi:MAG: hypothetical protein HUU34_18770 [Saprospiraceae bacterium]|nr:hypothetical protein [Saprospiraceae bacterium]